MWPCFEGRVADSYDVFLMFENPVSVNRRAFGWLLQGYRGVKSRFARNKSFRDLFTTACSLPYYSKTRIIGRALVM
jgi:hypothetical protein